MRGKQNNDAPTGAPTSPVVDLTVELLTPTELEIIQAHRSATDYHQIDNITKYEIAFAHILNHYKTCCIWAGQGSNDQELTSGPLRFQLHRIEVDEDEVLY